VEVEDFRMRWLRVTAQLVLLLLLTACLDFLTGRFRDADAKIEADRARFGTISSGRPVGSPCGDDDSASVKRRRIHPRWPTGGWSRLALLDASRQRQSDANEWMTIGGEFTGYVRFDEPGRLQARCYDDVYGEVYCGWAPSSVEYTPLEQHVLVAFDRCSVGDGGLDQVHEICWFPGGGDQGTIVYSTAHPQESSLEAHEVYAERHYSSFHRQGDTVRYIFDDRVADTIIRSLLRAGKLDQARSIVSGVLENLQFLPEVVDASTHEPIPKRPFYAEVWLKLLLLHAGLEIPGDTSLAALDHVEEVIATGRDRCYECRYVVGMIDLYRWAVVNLQGKRTPLPEIRDSASRVFGHNPYFISAVLVDPAKDEHTLSKRMLSSGGETTWFWMGIRALIAGDRDAARRYLERYIESPNQGMVEFELSAAATLVARMSADP
jgi:hypothetical protein